MRREFTPKGDELPLSLAQEQILRLQLNEEPGRYNLSAVYCFEGRIDCGALQSAIDRVMVRQDSLRTSFELDRGHPTQRVHGAVEVELHTSDHSSPMAPDGEQFFRRRLIELQRAPFDLSVVPLFRVEVIHLGDGSDVLIAVFDHLICDAESLDIFLGEVLAAYDSLVRGETPTFEPLPLQYGDFVVAERERIAADGGATLAAEMRYWKKTLAGVRLGPAVPFDFVPVRMSNRVVDVCIDLGPRGRSAVATTARDTRSTVFIVAAAVVQVVLSWVGGCTDLVLSTTLSGRRHVNVHNLIGMFAGVSRIRTDLAGNPTFKETIDRTRRSVFGMLEHQTLPFMQIRDALWPDFPTEGLGVMTAIPNEFGYFRERGPNPRDRAVILGKTLDYYESRGQLHPLSVSVFDDGSRLLVKIGYKTDFYLPRTVQALATGLAQMFASLRWARDVRLAELQASLM